MQKVWDINKKADCIGVKIVMGGKVELWPLPVKGELGLGSDVEGNRDRKLDVSQP